MDNLVHEKMFNDQMRDVAEYVVENNCVDGAALGVARQVLANGYASLTDAQKKAFEVARANAKPRCAECGEIIAEDELYLGGTHCDNCDHMFKQMEKD